MHGPHRSLAGLLVGALLFVACSSTAQVTAADTADESPVPTPTPTAMPEPSPTATTEPTTTPEPTATATPEPPTPDEARDELDAALEEAEAAREAAEEAARQAAEGGEGDAESFDSTFFLGDTIVTLENTGAEPRMELRYDIPPSCPEIMTVNDSTGFELVLDGVELPSEPPLATVAELRASAATVPEGFLVTSEILSMDVVGVDDPFLESIYRSELEPIIGVRTSEVITDRGIAVPGTFSIDDGGAFGDLGNTLEQLSDGYTSGAAFPVEPVGVGARWRVVSSGSIPGLDVETLLFATVRSIDDSIVTLDLEQSFATPPDSTFEASPGLVVDVVEMTGEASGSIIVDLEAIAPIASTMEAEVVVTIDGDPGPGTELVTVRIDQRVEIEGRLDAGCTPRPGRIQP